MGELCNQWEVLPLDGEVLGVRVLRHPHVNVQPFTQSLKGVSISPSLQEAKIRVRDSVHGYWGKRTNHYHGEVGKKTSFALRVSD